MFRSKEEFLFVFGGFNTDGFVSVTEVLDAKRGIWRKFDYCTPAKTQFATCAMPLMDGFQMGETERPSIWIIGGRDQQEAQTDEIIRFNPNEMRSERLDYMKLPEKLNGLSVVSIKSKPKVTPYVFF